MDIGNWKSHTIVKCAKCAKLMAFYIEVKSATCNDCDNSEQVRIYMEKTRHSLKRELAK